MTAGHVIPAFKKIGELLADYLAGATGIDIISYRISPWGPGGNPMSPFTAAPQLVHAAARGTAPDFSALRSPPFAGDGFDMCYVKDCARAIALLQLAPRLRHRTYNIASGTVLTNRDVAAAIARVRPRRVHRAPRRPQPGRHPGRGSASISAGCAKTPATSPVTTPTGRSPTTSGGYARVTSASFAPAPDSRSPAARGERGRGRRLLRCGFGGRDARPGGHVFQQHQDQHAGHGEHAGADAERQRVALGLRDRREHPVADPAAGDSAARA